MRAAGLLVVVALAGDARADLRGRFAWRGDAILRLEGAPAAAPAAPKPIAVRWKPVKLGSIDLGAPLVAVAAADLDGDGKGELYLVTAREVIAVGAAGRVKELGRVAFAGEPAVPRPRDVVGTAIVEGDALVAAASAWAKELRVTWGPPPAEGGARALVAHPGSSVQAAGFALCPGERAPLAAGRDYFETKNGPAYAVACRASVRASLAVTGKLAVELAGGRVEVPNAGVAFEIADVDRDGAPEIIVSDASAPGDPDGVRVYAAASLKKPLYKKAFAGGVAGIAAVDGDGDGIAEIVAVTRLAGATRVDLWRLD